MPSPESPRKPFLVVYDYTTGGVWAIMRARSAAEIVAKYPELRVFEQRPSWMSEEDQVRIASETFDIDAEPSGWLLAVVKERR